MSLETLVPEMDVAVGEGIVVVYVVEEGPGPMFRAPDFNPCHSYAESVNPMFDPRCLTSSLFSSMRIAPNTYLLATTQLVTLSPWWR